MGQKFRVTTEQERANFISFIGQLNLDVGYEFEWRKWREKRSNSANALFHVWCKDASIFFDIRPSEGLKAPEVMKMVFKEMFLGREDVVLTDKMTLPGQLKQTSKLNTSEFCYFMQKVDDWCGMRGCALPHPEDNEYMEWQKQQNT